MQLSTYVKTMQPLPKNTQGGQGRLSGGLQGQRHVGFLGERVGHLLKARVGLPTAVGTLAEDWGVL